jgi:hypothetical protein
LDLHKTEEILAKKRPSNHLKTPVVNPKKLKKLFISLPIPSMTSYHRDAKSDNCLIKIL